MIFCILFKKYLVLRATFHFIFGGERVKRDLLCSKARYLYFSSFFNSTAMQISQLYELSYCWPSAVISWQACFSQCSESRTNKYEVAFIFYHVHITKLTQPLISVCVTISDFFFPLPFTYVLNILSVKELLQPNIFLYKTEFSLFYMLGELLTNETPAKLAWLYHWDSPKR